VILYVVTISIQAFLSYYMTPWKGERRRRRRRRRRSNEGKKA
jgi:hypothetical protein